MDRLRAMEVFVAVAEAGSFAAAGVRLGMSPPAVTRAVAAVEDRLGARLLNRTTRRLSLTEAGSRYLESARRLVAEIEAADRAAAGELAAPCGRLTLTCSVTFGRLHGVELVAAFLREQPRLAVTVLMLDRIVDLVDEGVDVAIRIGALPDSSLIAHRVGETRRLLVASPAYLQRHGRPERPGNLKGHDVIAFTGLMPGRDWRHTSLEGHATGVAHGARLTVNDACAALAAAARGEGLAVALSYMVQQMLADGRLSSVLENFEPSPEPIHIVYPLSRPLAPKIRAFVDFATPWLHRRLK